MANSNNTPGRPSWSQAPSARQQATRNFGRRPSWLSTLGLALFWAACGVALVYLVCYHPAAWFVD